MCRNAFRLSLIKSRRVLQPLACFTAWLVLFGPQSALAQSVSCSQIVPFTPPPPNTTPINNSPIALNLGSLQLDPSGSVITQSLQNIQTNLSLNQISLSNLPSTGIGVVGIVKTSSGAITCQGGGPSLIPAWCVNLSVAQDVFQYQADIAQQFLSVFHIITPSNTAAVQMILDRANLKLLEQYYAFMLADLEAMISADQSTLTAHQSNVLTWFQSLVWTNEQNDYNAASAAINDFEGNCNWKPDPDIALADNLTYNRPVNCTTGSGGEIGGQVVSQIPPKDYFLDVGFKQSYGKVISQDTDGSIGVLNQAMLTELGFPQRIGDELGTALNTAWQSQQQLYNNLRGGLAGTVIPATYAASFWYQKTSSLKSILQPFANRPYHKGFLKYTKLGSQSEAATEIKNSTRVAGIAAQEEETYISKAIQTVSTRVVQLVGTEIASDLSSVVELVGSGPVAVVALVIDIVVQAIQSFVAYADNRNDYTTIQNEATTLQTTPPTLSDFLGDDTGQLKLATTLAAAAYPLPNLVSNLPAESNTANLVFQITSGGIQTQASSVQLSNWNGVTQTISLAGDWFTESDSTSNGTPVVSRVPIFHYLDWTGRQWWAARFGDSFLVAKSGYESQANGDAFQDVGGCGVGTAFPQPDASLFQPQQQSSGAQNAYCSTFVTNTIQAKVNNQQLTIQIGALPAIQSIANGVLSFKPGSTARIDIPVKSNPQAQISVSGLPSGFTYSVNADNSVLLLDTNLTSNGGVSQPVSITANNGFGSTTKVFTVQEMAGSDTPVPQGPTSLTFTGGQPVNFSITIPAATKASLNSPGPGQTIINAVNISAGSSTTAAMSGLQVTDQSTSTKFQFNISGSPALSGTFPNTPLTGALQFQFTIWYYSVEQQLTVGKDVTYNLPFTYIATPDPIYNVSPILMYNGVDNVVNLTPTNASSAKTQYSVAVTGGPSCTNEISYSLGQNDTIILKASASATQTYQAKKCGFALQVKVAGDGAPPLGFGKANSYLVPISFLTIPQFTSIANPIFQLGSAVNFPVTFTGTGTLTASQPLPAGLQLVPQGTAYAITGTPTTEGEFKLKLVAAGPDGSSTQNLNIRVWQKPVFTSPTFYNVPVNTPYTISVQAGGYPNSASDPCSGTGMNFSYDTFAADNLITGAKNLTSAGTTTNQYQINVGPQSFPRIYNEIVNATNQAGSSSEGLTVRIFSPSEVSCQTVETIRLLSGATTNLNNFVFDYNNDGVIDTKDLLVVSKYLPKGVRCQ